MYPQSRGGYDWGYFFCVIRLTEAKSGTSTQDSTPTSGRPPLLTLTVAGIRWPPDASGHLSALTRLRVTGTYRPQLVEHSVLPYSHGNERF